MNHRTEQVEAALKRAIGTVLMRGLADPRYRGIVSVTEVKLDHDQREARVGVSVLPAERGRATVAALKHAASHVRREVGEEIRIRRMPELRFELDESLKKQAEVLGAIRDAMDTTDGPDGSGEAEDGTSDE